MESRELRDIVAADHHREDASVILSLGDLLPTIEDCGASIPFGFTDQCSPF